MCTRARRPRRQVAAGCSLLLLAGLAVTDAAAQTASALLREGETIGTSGTVNSINNPSVNHVGGFSVQMNTLSGATTLSHIWGNASGGPGALLITEGTFGGFQQIAFESFNGLNDRGETCYSPTATELATGITGLDAAFLDGTPLLVERQAVSTIPGQFSVFNSRVGCTSTEPYWVGGISPTQGGSTQRNVLFYGLTRTPVLIGGTVIGGVNVAHQLTGMDFDVRFSRLGTHYILDATVTGATTNDHVIAVDGSALVAGGGFVREGLPVPAAIGGLPAENWANFDFLGVTESGRAFVTGDTAATTTVDEFVLDNGQIVLREGTVFAGPGGNYTISGDIEGGYQNRQGDWAVTWDANPPVGVNIEVLFVNGRMVLKEGDLVDLSGDGVPEANSKLFDFTGISSLVLGPRDSAGNVTVYFTADVDVNGTPTSTDDVEALLRITVPSGVVNQPPVAGCRNVKVEAGAGCVADADVDDASSDPDDDPFTLGQSPAGPYPIGNTSVTLTVTDVQGGVDTCTAQVTVISACDDGNACTADSCSPEGGCINDPIDCDDGNPCTDDSCDPASGCVYVNNSDPCDDGNACVGGDTCIDGACTPTQPVDCDDANACTVDACDPASGCTHETDLCDDGNACTADSCDPTTGCAHETIVCDDFDQCTEDACDPASGCYQTPIVCDDNNLCTVDSCDSLQGCRFEPISCDDGNACTQDFCDPSSGICDYQALNCDDGNACTTEYCDPISACVSEPVNCDDGNACTDDSCDPFAGCQNAPVNCDDANACTLDSCDSALGCTFESVVCDDGSACTADSCDPGTGCVFDPVGAEEANPRTIGYWKRLCQGPHSGDELAEADAACVAAQGDTFAGVSSVADICAVLQQGGGGGTCGHTEIDLMSLALNQCHVRVCAANEISSQYSQNTTVGESYAQADDILTNGGDCLLAKHLLEEINNGRALNLSTVSLSRAAGGGARLVWEPPYAVNPIKYNVWRRPAGSLAPFSKIGETTTPVFDDATPGSFQYEVTPVR